MVRRLILFITTSSSLFGQIPPVDVADLTIKIGGLSTEELYYGFAEGDQLLFSFEEEDGKQLKEVEIVELPGNSKFKDFKSSKVENKTLNIHRKNVYQFRFSNSALGKRVVKVHIQRIPKSKDLIAFNTNWEWKILYDTTYVPYTEDSLTGYNTVTVRRSKKELVKVDTIVTELSSKTERVHSETAIGKTQYAYLDVHLPQNSYSPNKFNPYQSTEVLAWSYWIGVGQKAKEDYEATNRSLAAGITTVGSLTGYGALTSLAVSGISMFGTPSVGDNVGYEFITTQNGVRKVFDSGNGIAASGRHTNLRQGGFTIQLFNDNIMEGIDVTVKVVAVTIRKTWRDREYTEQKQEPKYVTLRKQRMVIHSKQVRINAN